MMTPIENFRENSWDVLSTVCGATGGLVLHPGYIYCDPRTRRCRVLVQGLHFGRIRARLRHRFLVRLLRRVMRVPARDLSGPLFRERIAPFFREGCEDERIRVEIRPGLQIEIATHRRDGRFRGWWDLPASVAEELQQDGLISDGWLQFHACTKSNPEVRVPGRAQLIPPQGVSVITDIDDTIKLSEVSDRRALLRNTFLREFHAVQGMSDVYRHWDDSGAVIHYVSSSPCPLYEPIRGMLSEQCFPLGSMHLRSVHLHNGSLVQLLLTKPSSKRRMLNELLRNFPQRQFVLVGDSGEKDPEIYGALARRYRARIRNIFIRRTVGRRLHAERCRRAFRCLPFEQWKVFRQSEELLDLLPATELRRIGRATVPTLA